jgi:hypothetical protein
MDIYALVAVATEPGERPDKSLLKPTTVAEATRMVADGFKPPPSTKVLATPPGASPVAGNVVTRGFSKHALIAYVTSAGDQPVAIRYKMENVEGPSSIAIYAADGKRIPAAARSAQAETLLTLPALSAGSFYSLVINLAARHYSLSFPQAGGACFEASQPALPVHPGRTGRLHSALLLRAQGVQKLPNLPEHASVLDGEPCPGPVGGEGQRGPDSPRPRRAD